MSSHQELVLAHRDAQVSLQAHAGKQGRCLLKLMVPACLHAAVRCCCWLPEISWAAAELYAGAHVQSLA